MANISEDLPKTASSRASLSVLSTLYRPEAVQYQREPFFGPLLESRPVSWHTVILVAPILLLLIAGGLQLEYEPTRLGKARIDPFSSSVLVVTLNGSSPKEFAIGTRLSFLIDGVAGAFLGHVLLSKQVSCEWPKGCTQMQIRAVGQPIVLNDKARITVLLPSVRLFDMLRATNS